MIQRIPYSMTSTAPQRSQVSSQDLLSIFSVIRLKSLQFSQYRNSCKWNWIWRKSTTTHKIQRRISLEGGKLQAAWNSVHRYCAKKTHNRDRPFPVVRTDSSPNALGGEAGLVSFRAENLGTDLNRVDFNHSNRLSHHQGRYPRTFIIARFIYLL